MRRSFLEREEKELDKGPEMRMTAPDHVSQGGGRKVVLGVLDFIPATRRPGAVDQGRWGRPPDCRGKKVQIGQAS